MWLCNEIIHLDLRLGGWAHNSFADVSVHCMDIRIGHAGTATDFGLYAQQAMSKKIIVWAVLKGVTRPPQLSVQHHPMQ
jgi:hypothetical protein